jgi:hypothetical protein
VTAVFVFVALILPGVLKKLGTSKREATPGASRAA